MSLSDLIRAAAYGEAPTKLQRQGLDKEPASANSLEQTSCALSLVDFFRAVLPAQGRLILYQNKKHSYFDSIEALTLATQARSGSQGLYFAVASFGDEPNRRGDNVHLLQAHRVDIDAGAAKFAKHGDAVYPTQQKAKRALTEAVRAGLPRPSLVVSSGEGLHVYWALVHPTAREHWKPVALALGAVCKALGLKVDSSCTADTARILRPIGTLHPNGQRVELLKDTGVRHDQGELMALLQPLVPEGARFESRGVAVVHEPSINDDVLAFPERAASLAQVAEHCSATARLRDTKGNVPEPLWRAIIGVGKYCVADGPQLIHEWSSGYEGYTVKETQDKLNRWVTPPPTCAYISTLHEGCAVCPYRRKITTPKQLGATNEAELEHAASPVRDSVATANEVEEINKSFFVAADSSGIPYIWREFLNPETKCQNIASLNKDAFGLLFANRKVKIPFANKDGEVIYKHVPLANHWIGSPLRREYRNIALLPEGPAPDGTYNLWKGFAVTPTVGDVRLMTDHINMVCGGDPAAENYLLNWLAFCVQRPGQRPEVAIALRGGRGTGKGIVFKLLLHIFGNHGLHITNSRLLTGDFNGHMRHALFVFVDEALWAGDKQGEGVLKGLITEPTITINGKFKDVLTAVNRLKIGFASNNDWVVPAGSDERRFMVCDVPSTYRGDHAYFSRLYNWVDNGGAGMWLAYLLKRDVSHFNPRIAPSNTALDKQKLASMSTFEKWIVDALDQGCEPGEATAWGTEGLVLSCLPASRRYAECVRTSGGRWAKPLDSRSIGSELQRIFDCGPARSVRIGATTERAWYLPGLQPAREAAATALGLDHYQWAQA